MNLQNLYSKFSEEQLSATCGDNELRYQAFSSVILHLSKKKAVYHERNTNIVTISDISITQEGFVATATPNLFIPHGRILDQFAKNKPWKFGSTWAFVRLSRNRLGTYSGWLIWPEPEIVQNVEELAIQRRFDEALDLLSI